MNPQPNWSELVARLEADLKARDSFGQNQIVDNDAWQTAAQLVRSRAQILAFGFYGLQTADVEDLVQSVLLKLQSSVTMSRLRAARSVEGYIFVMLRNAANDLVRRRQVERLRFSSLQEHRPTEPLTDPQYAQDTENATLLAGALALLSEEDRELLRMRFWRNLSIAEIAAETGLSYSATAVRLFRLLHRLRDQLRS